MKTDENCEQTTHRKWVGESNGDVTFGLGRHLAAEITFSQITRKPSQIDENVNGPLIGTLGR
jgi:hypothetical protein